MERFSNYINGEWRAPSTRKYVENINPANPDEILGMFPASGEQDVDEALVSADRSFSTWSRQTASVRSNLLFSFANLLEKHAEELGRIITMEQGKPISESVGEVKRAAAEARYMAGEALRLAGETLPSERPNTLVQRIREPLGVVAAITPWNFPVVAPVRKIAPALACGDTVVFKPATDTPWTAVYLLKLLEEAGCPPGVVNLVMGSGSTAGQRIISSDIVKGITFTGSTSVGTKLYETAAKHLARVQLELGGKNAAVVYDAYDLENVAQEIVAAAFTTTGQRCTAISRVIVKRSEAEKLTELIVNRVKQINVGNGLDAGVTMGPVVSKNQLEQVERYVGIAKDEGCTILTGGERVPGIKGYFYEPTVVTGVFPSSPLAKEEMFGPILPILIVDDFEEAIHICNDTIYGLAACVFTRDLDKALDFSSKVNVGMVHINHGTASQAHVPFGGVKASGQGAYSIGGTVKDFFMVDKVVYSKIS